ncbi:MAG: hypothetical protein KF895_03290 [Parvibaculum sp.]|nr:hypothetical protein [Parvibaculum sp.]
MTDIDIEAIRAREEVAKTAKQAGIAAIKTHWASEDDIPEFIKMPRKAYLDMHAAEARRLSDTASREGTDPINEALRTMRTAGLLAPEQGSYHHHCIIAADGALIMYDALLSALEAANKRADEAEALVYAPGLWKCAKCDFVLQQSNLNARDGTVTARDTPGDKCPNCNSPLWRVSWKEEAADRLATVDRFFDELTALRARVAELEGALKTARTYVKDMSEMIPHSPEGYTTKGTAIRELAEIDAALKGASHDAG